jgi:hypothetical protein
MVNVSTNSGTSRASASSAGRNASADVSADTSSYSINVTNDSTIYYAHQAELSAEEAKRQAELAEYYAGLSVSAIWIKVSALDWVQEGNLYKYTIDGILAVLSVYRGEWNNKELITNVDVTITDLETYIFSSVQFDGYILASKTILESEDYVPATVDTLAAMLETDIIRLTEGD